MKINGYDRFSGYLMWRCPYGKDDCSKCKNNCTDWDIWLYTDIPRGTDAYKKIYKQHTATERINKPILNDYSLYLMFIHTKEHYSFVTTRIDTCIHLDALYKQQMQATA